MICAGLELRGRGNSTLPVVWSVHPRTRGEARSASGRSSTSAIQLHEPFGFLDFVRLEASARCVVTDSGTVQEECSLLRVPDGHVPRHDGAPRDGRVRLQRAVRGAATRSGCSTACA